MNDKIFAYDLQTKARDPDKDFDTLAAAGNASPRGIWSNGDIMWVVERRDGDKIYAYDLQTKERVTGEPQISITPGPVVTEGENAVFTITVHLPSITDVVINLATTQTGDFISGAPAATVTLSARHTATQYTIATVNDNIDEPDGNVTVTLQDGGDYAVVSPSSATVNVADNDIVPAVVALSAQDKDGNVVSEINEGEAVTFVAAFSPHAPFTPDVATDIRYTISRTGDYVDAFFTGERGAVIHDGDATAAVFFVTSRPADGVAGSGGAIIMRLLPDDPAGRATNVGAGVLYTLGSPAAVTVMISDVDTTPTPPVMTIEPTVVDSYREGHGVWFKARADKPLYRDLDVAVDLQPRNMALHPDQATRVTVNMRKGARSKNFLVRSRPSDNVDAADGVVTAVLATPAADAGYTLGATVSADIVVYDGYDRPFVGIVAAIPTVREGPDTHAAFVLTVSRAQAEPLLVAVDLRQKGNYVKGRFSERIGRSFHIPAGAATYTYSVAIADDARAEEDGEIIASTVADNIHYQQRPGATAATVIVHDDDSEQALTARQTHEINQAIAPQVAAAVSRQSMQITQTRIAHHLNGRPAYHVQGSHHLAGFLKRHGNDLPDMDIGQLDFSLPLQSANRDGGVDHLTVWRQHYQSGFSAHADSTVHADVRADSTSSTSPLATGAVTGSITGIDARINHNTLFGVGFNQSRAESDFEHAGIHGRHVTQLTGIRPYLAWQNGNQSHVEGSLGLDRGEIEITVNGYPADTRRLDVTLANVHLGGQGMLYREQSDDDTTTLNLVADAAWSGMESTDVHGIDIHDGLIRMGADYRHRRHTAQGWTWERNLEMTIRREYGERGEHHGDHRGGIAIDGAFKAHAPHSNIRYRLDVNTLRGRDNTTQWGVAGDITLSPDTDQHGLSLSFKSQWGIVQSHGAQLWRHGIVDETDTVDDNPRYAIEVQYGIALTHEAERLTLFARDENNTVGLGCNYPVGDDFTAGYEALDTPDTNPATDHRGTVRYRRRF